MEKTKVNSCKTGLNAPGNHLSKSDTDSDLHTDRKSTGRLRIFFIVPFLLHKTRGRKYKGGNLRDNPGFVK